MRCIGCSHEINPIRGWVAVTKKRMVDLNSHGELETEAAFTACSWDCVLAGGEMVGLDGMERRERA